MSNRTSETLHFKPIRKSLGAAALALAVGAGSAFAPGTSAAATISDSAVTSKVKVALMADDVTRSTNINVDSENGMVTLRGTAPTEAAKRKAAEIALAADGTTSVVNELVVGDTSSNPQTMTAKAKRAGEDTGAKVSDAWITTQVKTRLLADEDIKGTKINVSTEQGEVMLAGRVPSRAMHDKAVLIAHRVDGVRDVDAEALLTKDE